MRATAEPEEGNKVRLSVEIEEAEMDEALDEVMRRLSREVRVPGFRPGKVPRRVIEARMGGATALRGEALREALPTFYARAVTDTEVDPIDQPEIDITSGDDAGPVSFDAVVMVRPTVAIPGYQGLVVTLPDLEVTDEEIDAQVDRLRSTSGELVEIARPAVDGDQVTIDIHGTRNGGRPRGTTAISMPRTISTRWGAQAWSPSSTTSCAGPRSATSSPSTRRSAMEPDHLVQGAGEGREGTGPPRCERRVGGGGLRVRHDRRAQADIAERLRQRHVVQAQMALQQKTADALVELVTEEIPDQLVAEELRERIHDLNHRLESQGMSLGQFLGATGRDEQEFLEELRAGALHSVKVDLALRSLVDEENIEISDEELDEELAAMGERLEMDVNEVRDQLERAGRLPAVRSDRRKAKAMRWLIDNVDLIDEEGKPVSRDDLQVNQGEEDSE